MIFELEKEFRSMKLKFYSPAVFITTLLLISSIAFAHGMQETKDVDETMSEIFSSQNVTSIKKIDCNKVSVLDFADLGDAVMDRMVGSHELHEQMDLMMGGEGSDSLQAVHVAMGQNWLGCGNSFQGTMGYGMMGNSNMMPMMMRMMGNYYPAYYSGYDTVLIFGIIGWILFVLSSVILILVFTGNIKIRRRG